MNLDWIDDEELLYRAVLSNSSLSQLDRNSLITPTLFMDAKGVSVDRDGDRPEEECVDCFRRRFSRTTTQTNGKSIRSYQGTVRLNAHQCRAVAAFPRPAVGNPKHNPYHAHICNSDCDTDFEISILKATQLLNMCSIVELAGE